MDVGGMVGKYMGWAGLGPSLLLRCLHLPVTLSPRSHLPANAANESTHTFRPPILAESLYLINPTPLDFRF